MQMWTSRDSGSAVLVLRLGVGLRGNGVTGVMLLVISPTLTVQFVEHWAGRPNQRVALCLRRGAQGQGHGLFHHGTKGMCLRRGLG